MTIWKDIEKVGEKTLKLGGRIAHGAADVTHWGGYALEALSIPAMMAGPEVAGPLFSLGVAMNNAGEIASKSADVYDAAKYVGKTIAHSEVGKKIGDVLHKFEDPNKYEYIKPIRNPKARLHAYKEVSNQILLPRPNNPIALKRMRHESRYENDDEEIDVHRKKRHHHHHTTKQQTKKRPKSQNSKLSSINRISDI
jgi:hypothetical protein